jgi:hypothetical protein
MKTTRTQIARLLLCSSLIAVALPHPLSDTHGWGPQGHEMSGRAAAMKLSEQMPKFFRTSVAQLGYLNPEPTAGRSWRPGGWLFVLCSEEDAFVFEDHDGAGEGYGRIDKI